MKWCGCFSKKEKPVTIITLEERPHPGTINGDPSFSATDQDGHSDFESSVDWKIDENKKSNKTDCYDQNDLILRRANIFKFSANFSRGINEAGDIFGLELKTGKTPNLKAGTLVRFDAEIDGDLKEESWSATVTGDEKLGHFTVNIPASAAIGRYSVRLYVRTVTKDGEISTSYSSQPDLYVVANPWSKDDECYFNKCGIGIFNNFDEFIDEYVLNEVGAIWRGSATNHRGKHWTFGQFEEPCLEIACRLIANDSRTSSASGGAKLGDLVQIVRILSAAGNANDGSGVLVGNWTGDYSDGKHPVSWQSSVSILRQYKDQNFTSVKYAQCWVFSGLLTTLLRALGIPARSVTNFDSAHDTDNTMTIDTYVDKFGNEHGKSDSVWNFHVWNECWLNRRDLPAGYGGWQAVDATPQEGSNGISQCGPAPLTAIKKGETFLNFETNFVYGEVNADRCTWLCEVGDDNSIYPTELTSRRRDTVGRFISTKAAGKGNFAREDITALYKYSEGTPEEAKSFEKAFQYTGNRPNRSFMAKHLLEEPDKKFAIRLSVLGNAVKLGDDMKIRIELINGTGCEVDLENKPVITINSTFQRGGIGGLISRETLNVDTVDSSWSENILISHDAYKDQLAGDGHGLVQATCLVRVKCNGQSRTYTERLTFNVEIPEKMVDINMSHVKCRVKDVDVAATVCVTNKLPYTLTNILLTVDGRGLFPTKTSQIAELKPGYRVQSIIKFVPEKAGSFTIMVDVDSAQVKDIKNFASLEVLELL